MKKLLLLIMLLSSPLIDSTVSAQPYSTGFQQYINYVGQARQAVSSQYPNASVVDFLYVGCMAQTASTTDFIYKFWLREGTREFGAYVTVSVDRSTNRQEVTSIEKTDSTLPSYEKWRQYAVQSVKSKYPTAEIIDYHPYECKWMSPNQANQSFTFWLQENNVDRFIITTITYKINTEEIISVQFEPRR